MNLGRALWLINISLEFAVLALLIWRKAVHTYPTFFVYCLLGAIQSLILLLLAGRYKPYLWTYWTMEIAGLIVLGVVLLDLFERLLPADARYRAWGRAAFYLICFFAVGVAIFSVPAQAGTGIGPVNQIGLRAEEGITIIHAILVAFIVLYTAILRPPWPTPALWIFIGICFLVATELLVIDQFLHLGIARFRLYSWTKTLSPTAALLAWCWGFGQRQELPSLTSRVAEIKATLSEVAR